MSTKRHGGHPAKRTDSRPKNRISLWKFLLICLPLWFSFKFYGGPYHEQVRTYVAAMLFIIICALIVQSVLPRLREPPLLIGLFLMFCVIELIAWRFPDLLSHISVTLAGHQLVGGEFSLNKIPYYGVGGFIGYFILTACRR